MNNKKEIKNAVIKNVNIGFDETGKLTAWVIIDFGNAKQGFGGLDLNLGNNLMRFFNNMFLTINAAQTDLLMGKAVRVLHDDKKIYALGNFIEDKWYHLDGGDIISEVNLLTRCGEPGVITQEDIDWANKVIEDADGKKHYGMKAQSGMMGADIC